MIDPDTAARRDKALQMALDLARMNGGSAEETLIMARKFEAYLSGQDETERLSECISAGRWSADTTADQ